MTHLKDQTRLGETAQTESAWTNLHKEAFDTGYSLSVRYGRATRIFEIAASHGEQTEVGYFKATNLYRGDTLPLDLGVDDHKIQQMIAELGERLPKLKLETA